MRTGTMVFAEWVNPKGIETRRKPRAKRQTIVSSLFRTVWRFAEDRKKEL
jgi:hypothetical protein